MRRDVRASLGQGLAGASQPLRRAVVGFVLGAVAVVLLHLAGWSGATRDALVEMGFDPDRARLIEALTMAALASGVGAIATGRRVGPTAVALATVAAIFGPTFVAETAGALAPGGAGGSFDPVGWTITLATLIVSGVVAGWGAATLVREVRGWLLAGADLVGRVRRSGSLRGVPVARTAAPLVALLAVLVVLPTFSVMMNYSPDAQMRSGGLGSFVPLVGGAPSGGAPTEATPGSPVPGGAQAGAAAPGSSPGARPVSLPPSGILSPGAVSPDRPWAASIPPGTSTLETSTLPAPWTGGRYTRALLWVYLPAGYRSSAQRYPTIYAVPWDLSHWELGAHLVQMLDGLIHAGAIPPTIVVFVDLTGGPFPVSECADSYDGLEHTDTYVASTVVAWADSHYRTIAQPEARTLLGFSEGGFCAANLLLRHPGVFANAIAFDGYYVAGFRSSQTVNAWRPWGNSQALIAANSPLDTAGRLPAAVRHRLFVVLSAWPAEPIYGQQATAFARELEAYGYAYDFLWTPLGHAWKAVTAELPPALEAVAGHQVAAGLFTPGATPR